MHFFAHKLIGQRQVTYWTVLVFQEQIIYFTNHILNIELQNHNLNIELQNHIINIEVQNQFEI